MTAEQEGRAWGTHEPPWLDLLNNIPRPDQHKRMSGTLRQRAAQLAAEQHDLVDELEHIPLAGAAWWYAAAGAGQQIDDPGPDADQPVFKPREVGPWPCQIPPAPTCPDCGDDLEPGPFAAAVHCAVYAGREQEHLSRRRRKKLRR